MSCPTRDELLLSLQRRLEELSLEQHERDRERRILLDLLLRLRMGESPELIVTRLQGKKIPLPAMPRKRSERVR